MTYETTELLTDRYRRLHAEYRNLGAQARGVSSPAPGRPRADHAALFARLQELYEEVDRVQRELNRRMKPPAYA